MHSTSSFHIYCYHFQNQNSNERLINVTKIDKDSVKLRRPRINVCVCVETIPPFLKATPFFFHSSFLALKTSNRDSSSFHSVYLEPSNIRLEVFSAGKLEWKKYAPPPPHSRFQLHAHTNINSWSPNLVFVREVSKNLCKNWQNQAFTI